MEALRNKPDVDARGFNGRDERVVLPVLTMGAFAVGLTGLGDLSRGDENLEEALPLREVDGVLINLVVPGRLSGV